MTDNDEFERNPGRNANALPPGTAGARRGRVGAAVARLAELAALRFELFAVDLELGALQLLGVAVLVLGALALALAGLGLLVAALLLAAPEGWRWAVAAACGLGCWGGGAWLLWRARRRLAGWRPFAATLAELGRDRDML
ncbi:MAG: phage holin family protein [Pelomonas sp.]|nr:phage holin family protein [Roseateles sp.]